MRLGKVGTALAIGAVALMAAPPLGQAAAKYKEVAVADGGTIKGKVGFEGPLPGDAVENILITKNPEVCGTGEREVVWVDVEGGALRGTFVFIDDIAAGKKWAVPEGGHFLITQKGCRFIPWAQVVRPGPITVRNSDPGVLHNINTREIIYGRRGRMVKRTMFNFGQPDPGDIEQEVKPRRSPFISINCEAHNFMYGFMMAPEHPYAVVVGDDGSFALEDVPPGAYTVTAWHPRLGFKEAEVTVPAKGEATADFTFTK